MEEEGRIQFPVANIYDIWELSDLMSASEGGVMERRTSLTTLYRVRLPHLISHISPHLF